jgi:F0F1-type ATP synthase membrane subunit c/vacuolar-type H+-ATPase subunit K
VLDVSDDIVELDIPELIMPELVDESGAAIGAGAGTGAVTGAGAGVSSFLPQAVRATAKSEAASSDLFMIFLLVS